MAWKEFLPDLGVYLNSRLFLFMKLASISITTGTSGSSFSRERDGRDAGECKGRRRGPWALLETGRPSV